MSLLSIKLQLYIILNENTAICTNDNNNCKSTIKTLHNLVYQQCFIKQLSKEL